MYKNKISAVYKIVNTATGDFYIGSSADVKRRWKDHKLPSTWTRYSNNKMYQDMQEYGLECFNFGIVEEVEPENLRQEEQKFIELLKPTYNNYNAKGWNVERVKAYQREYNQSEKGKARSKKYRQSEKGKETSKKYYQSENCKQTHKKYYSQLCIYNSETLTLSALETRFRRAGISHPVLEAKKYLINVTN